MNKPKTSNLLRSIAFFLTAVVLTCTFGFTVDGWITADVTNFNRENITSSGIVLDDKNCSESEDNTEQNDSLKTVYINFLTGEETDEKTANSTRFAFILDPNAPLFGIDSADILVEFPTENEESRYLAITSGSHNLWKIGSILSSKGYISNYASYFDANLFSFGSDEKISYDICDLSGKHFDLSKNVGYSYTEQEKFCFTNRDLIDAACENMKISNDPNRTSPLVFSGTDEKISFEHKAASASLPTSVLFQSQIIYNGSSQKYSIIRNGETVRDQFNGKSLEFTNCLVLFADSVIYDNADCSQMIMSTIGTGHGLCLTNGTITEIIWVSSLDGTLSFYLKSGEVLELNRGRTYISFIKTSRSEYVEFS